MRLELGPLFADDPALGEAEHLIAAAVGEDGPIPADERVQPAEIGDAAVARAQEQVVGVAQDDGGADALEVAVQRRFHAALGADGHERGRLHQAMRRGERTEARAAVGRAQAESEAGHRYYSYLTVKKLRVGVIYGGRSGEHEVSIASAAAIFKHLDPARYDAVPIKIAKDGRWALGTSAPKALSAADVHKETATEALVPVDPSAALQDSGVDVVFPVLHGPYGEDGTVQGLLELANVPYVGAGVLGSAVGMDKAVMKALFAADNLPIVPHLTVLRRDWERAPADITGAVARDLRYPVFVKPANLGSSVGISKATSDESLADAMRLAFDFDRKVVVEAGVPDAREIECAVLGNDDPEASVPGEIIVTHADGFYSYAAKYLDPNGASWQIPADIAPETARAGPPPECPGVQGARARRDGTRGLLPGPAERRRLPQRGEHHSGVHHDLDVSQDVGSHRAAVSGAARPADRARHRAPRRKTAPAHQRT